MIHTHVTYIHTYIQDYTLAQVKSELNKTSYGGLTESSPTSTPSESHVTSDTTRSLAGPILGSIVGFFIVVIVILYVRRRQAIEAYEVECFPSVFIQEMLCICQRFLLGLSHMTRTDRTDSELF
jgi:hypothetical protein